jgi:hypothetical protein
MPKEVPLLKGNPSKPDMGRITEPITVYKYLASVGKTRYYETNIKLGVLVDEYNRAIF